jgi:hypothetical protein
MSLHRHVQANLAAEHNMFFTEASAKEGTNVEMAFEEMVTRFVRRFAF